DLIVTGVQTCALPISTGPAYRQVLVDVLARDYDPGHEVILYKAVTLPMHQPRIERLLLRDLPAAEVDMHMTLVIPPGSKLQADRSEEHTSELQSRSDL